MKYIMMINQPAGSEVRCQYAGKPLEGVDTYIVPCNAAECPYGKRVSGSEGAACLSEGWVLRASLERTVILNKPVAVA